MDIRTNWTEEEIEALYDKPLLELIFEAQLVHRKYHDPKKMQLCSLLSIKTGGCSEDCKYCPQSIKNNTDVKPEKMLSLEEVKASAKKALDGGSSRFCMGAAWRQARDGKNFENLLEMVKAVNGMGLEVCCTVGMLSKDQIQKLKEAGLYAYNHNIDTSRDYYKKIITTRTFDERLETLKNVREAGVSVCSGGIIGMGESKKDRVSFVHTLATMESHPDSVPINALIPVDGTPLGNLKTVDATEIARMIAVCRICMPKARVRFTAGRRNYSTAEQGLCFLAGANSIFSCEKLLTSPHTDRQEDLVMLEKLGLSPLKNLSVDAAELVSCNAEGREAVDCVS